MQGCLCVCVCVVIPTTSTSASPLAILPFHCPRCFCILQRICCTFYNSNRNCHPFAQFVVLAASVPPLHSPLPPTLLSLPLKPHMNLFGHLQAWLHKHSHTSTSYATFRCFSHFQFEIAAAAASPLPRPRLCSST